jgi:hypothetical protein
MGLVLSQTEAPDEDTNLQDRHGHATFSSGSDENFFDASSSPQRSNVTAFDTPDLARFGRNDARPQREITSTGTRHARSQQSDQSSPAVSCAARHSNGASVEKPARAETRRCKSSPEEVLCGNTIDAIEKITALCKQLTLEGERESLAGKLFCFA